MTHEEQATAWNERELQRFIVGMKAAEIDRRREAFVKGFGLGLILAMVLGGLVLAVLR